MKPMPSNPEFDRVDSGIAEQANLAWEQVMRFVDSSTPGGRASLSVGNVLSALILALSVLRLGASTVDEGLSLVPHHTVFPSAAWCPIPFVWNVATAHFFEGNVIKAMVVAPGVMFLSNLLERLWSAKSIVVHVLFTCFCAGSAWFLSELVHVYRTHHEKDFFVPVRGCAGLLVALAHGVRHAYPLEVLPGFPQMPGYRMKYDHLPFILTSLACCIGFTCPWLMEDWLFAPLAFVVGWVHLRYLMWFPNAQAHGDHSPDFLFSALFPRVLRPLVGCVGAIVHALVATVVPSFVRLRQAPESSETGIFGDPSVAAELGSFTGSGVLGAPETSPRSLPAAPGSIEYAARRAKALALLDQNISSLLSSKSPSAIDPSLLPPKPGGRPLALSRDFDLDPVHGPVMHNSAMPSAASEVASSSAAPAHARGPPAVYAAATPGVPTVGLDSAVVIGAPGSTETSGGEAAEAPEARSPAGAVACAPAVNRHDEEECG